MYILFLPPFIKYSIVYIYIIYHAFYMLQYIQYLSMLVYRKLPLSSFFPVDCSMPLCDVVYVTSPLLMNPAFFDYVLPIRRGRINTYSQCICLFINYIYKVLSIPVNKLNVLYLPQLRDNSKIEVMVISLVLKIYLFF